MKLKSKPIAIVGGAGVLAAIVWTHPHQNSPEENYQAAVTDSFKVAATGAHHDFGTKGFGTAETSQVHTRDQVKSVLKNSLRDGGAEIGDNKSYDVAVICGAAMLSGVSDEALLPAFDDFNSGKEADLDHATTFCLDKLGKAATHHGFVMTYPVITQG